jgi:hypothetical protein
MHVRELIFFFNVVDTYTGGGKDTRGLGAQKKYRAAYLGVVATYIAFCVLTNSYNRECLEGPIHS